MRLETADCISITIKSITYTDCMEFSLLRFIHLLAYCPKQMENSQCSKYSRKISSGRISQFVKKHNKIYPFANYYFHENLPGPKERVDWADFLSGKDFFDYYRNDFVELFPNVKNIIKFFNEFYSMGLNVNKHEESLTKIAKHFSSPDKIINISIKSIETNEQLKPLSAILQMLSRPDEEIKLIESNELSNKYFLISSTKTKIQININNNIYYWKLYEVKFKEKIFSNNFITGHSVIQ